MGSFFKACLHFLAPSINDIAAAAKEAYQNALTAWQPIYPLTQPILCIPLRPSLLTTSNQRLLTHQRLFLPLIHPVLQISEALGLPNLRNRQWSIQETSATKGKGLFEGFDWLSTAIMGGK